MAQHGDAGDDRGMKQTSFASLEYAGKKRQTRREKFLGEMQQVVPWSALIARIEPHYPRSGRVGRPPIGVPRMLRMYFLQQWYSLSDEGLEDAIYDSQAMRDFVGIDLAREQVPDATTLLKFRRLLEDKQLTQAIFEQVNAHLGQRGLLMREGTLVDATIIAAPPSTKNKDHARDPEMHQAKKGNQWRVSRTQAADLWCCTEDGSRPPEAGLQEQASNHPVLLRSRGVVVSDRAKVIPPGVAGTY
jgi:IS5 family transposase